MAVAEPSTRAAIARATALRSPPPLRACAASASPAVVPAGKRSVAPSSNVTLISIIPATRNGRESGGG